MRELLKRFADFDALPAAALAGVARRSRRLRVPARRWLVRPGRALPGRFYLLEGRVQLVEGGRTIIVSAGSGRARRAVYPGASAVETLTPALFLNVEGAVPSAGEALEERAGLGVPEVIASEPSWQRHFLTSPLMQCLAPAAWQRILRAMRRFEYQAGEVVIALGESADCCFVLCEGGAAILDAGGRLLAALTPGSLFGEDALVSGRVRNARVVMTSRGAVVSLPAQHFQAWLLDAVVRPLGAAHGRPTIGLDPDAEADILLPVAALRGAGHRLSPDAGYAIVGGSSPERALAAFLLAEQGIEARPVEPLAASLG